MKAWEYGKLRVSDNRKYLCNGDRPFFWLGDTAWLMFAKLTEEEAAVYLRNRKEKGYTVIQSTLIHEWPQKNRDGANALYKEDYATPDLEGGYWDRVEHMVSMAEELGIYMALLPTWGGNVESGRLHMGNVDAYLDFLLERFGSRPNIIWLAGGDVKGEAAPEVFCHIGKRLKEESDGHLVGFHPFGRTSSSQWFQEEDWLDFNMFQSGHRRYDQVVLGAWDDNGKNPNQYGEDNWRYMQADLAKTPLKPTIDGEPSYEQIVHGLHDNTQPYWQSWDTRRYAYWSVFAGAFGHTFGDNAIMQFFRKDLEKEGAFGVWQDWREALHNIGGMQMGHLKHLMESVDYQNGCAAQNLVTEGDGEAYERIAVFAGKDYIFCYDYTGHPFTLDLESYKGTFDTYWMDPVTGVFSYAGCTEGKQKHTFCPMKRLEGHSDWVLVLKKQEK